jgi:hypothetical protein
MAIPTRSFVAAVLVALVPLVGCAAAPALSPFPHGDAIQLLDHPAHLGDDRATGQSFPNGPATAARTCSLVNMPRTADVYIQVRDVRETESLSDVMTVNGRPYPLPITLERDPRGQTSNATSASPVERVHLEQGPSEICLVAGHRLNGDIDDFEVEALTMFVEGVDPGSIFVRRGLDQGRPQPSYPPSVPWGQRQGWPFSSVVGLGQ